MRALIDFIKRNMPVFVIGLITLGVFLIIIVEAQRSPKAGPQLEQIQKEQYVFDYTPTIGPKDSKIVLIEFSDFECPACKAFQPVIKSVIEKYKDRVLFVYKHLPSPQHTNAKPAAIASMAANQQQKFWEFSSLLFDAQPNFSQDEYIKMATTLGLDLERFKNDLNSTDIIKYIQEDLDQAIRIGLSSTPSFILNGRLLTVTGFDDIETEIKSELAKNNINTEPLITQVQETTESTPSAKPKTPQELAIDQQYGIIDIEYGETGFFPSNIKAIKGQLVRWTNKTKKDIYIQQIISKYNSLSEIAVIKSGQTAELRITHEGLWTYKEANQRHYGSIYSVTP